MLPGLMTSKLFFLVGTHAALFLQQNILLYSFVSALLGIWQIPVLLFLEQC